MQNLRQKGMTVKEYTEEFYRLNIRTGQRERDEEKVARYINGLRYEIQDELSMMSVRNSGGCLSVCTEGRGEVGQKTKPTGRGKGPVPKQKQGSYP
jgi:hypothetical protein